LHPHTSRSSDLRVLHVWKPVWESYLRTGYRDSSPTNRTQSLCLVVRVASPLAIIVWCTFRLAQPGNLATFRRCLWGLRLECFHQGNRFEYPSFNQAVPPLGVSPTFKVNVASSILPIRQMFLLSQIYCSYRLWRRYANVAHLLRFLLSAEGKSRLEIGSSLTSIPIAAIAEETSAILAAPTVNPIGSNGGLLEV
jgi:hypothetical protein